METGPSPRTRPVSYTHLHEYLSWDGKAEGTFSAVEGYIPTVQTAATPSGDGVLLENVNRLTGKRKVKYSPDGTSTAYKLPDKEVDEVVSVEGTTISHTLDLSLIHISR